MSNYIHQLLSQFLGPVMQALDDPHCEEVMINSPDSIWVETRKGLQKMSVPLTAEAIFGAVSMLGRVENKDVSENSENAILDTQLGDFRVAAALAPTSVSGHSMCIRRHSYRSIPISEFKVLSRAELEGDRMTAPADPLEHLIWAAQNKKTILVSGGTSTGKTTFLRSLIEAGVNTEERLIFIEDVPELRIDAKNQVRLKTNEQIGIDTRSLVRLALRYRPDRIFIGEVRGPESFDLLQAINTGHEGSMASIHANSAHAALSRLETLVLTAGTGWPVEAIRMQVASTIDYVVQMSRSKGRRVISEIIELRGMDAGNYNFHRIL